MTAIMLPALVGTVALVGLLTKSENQRVADLASYAGAVAYSRDESETAMKAAARHVAALNGVAAKDVTIALVVSPRSDESEARAVAVTITTVNPLALARVLGTGPELAIAS